jgi:hypothetical protein
MAPTTPPWTVVVSAPLPPVVWLLAGTDAESDAEPAVPAAELPPVVAGEVAGLMISIIIRKKIAMGNRERALTQRQWCG